MNLSKNTFLTSDDIECADLFAGGGGTSTGLLGIEGVKVTWALNHSPIAIKTHAANHPETKHYQADIRTQSTDELAKVHVLWASLECTEHSKAKGGADKEEGSFTLGWELHRYIKHCDPLVIYIENVPEFIRWGELKDGKRVKGKEGLEYLRWIQSIKDLGYTNYQRRFLNAADYGCPTRRIRYFGIFTKTGVPIQWPVPTHSEKDNMHGLQKWVPCKDYINLKDEGKSIFGRSINENIKAHQRKPLSVNTLKRIAGGVKKFAPDIYFIMKYYGNGDNCQSISEPLHTIRTHESHALITCEKVQFIQDHCQTDSYNLPEEPLRPQLTRQTKQLITIDKQFYTRALTNDYANQPLEKPAPTIMTWGSDSLVTVRTQFIAKYYGGNRSNGKIQHHCQKLDQPLPVITTKDHNSLITVKSQFISAQYNSNGNPAANNHPITDPLPSATTKEKFQFITTYFNSSGHPESQNQDIEKPLNTILTGTNKKALVTADNKGFDFDIKMRFLTADELASIMGFPEGYFTHPELKLSKKAIIEMVGNAVPTGMAKALAAPQINFLRTALNKQIA